MDILDCINDDIDVCFGVPVDLRLSRGRLRTVLPYTDMEVAYSRVEGELLGISRTKWHGWAYWCVSLSDGVNEYRLLFFERSAMFVKLVRCLIGRKVSHLSIMVGVLTDGSYQMIVEADGKRLVPANITLPPVKHIYKRKDGKCKEWHDYKARLNALQRIVDEIGQPTGAHKGEGC